jgi:tol-pal system protein YbgF
MTVSKTHAAALVLAGAMMLSATALSSGQTLRLAQTYDAPPANVGGGGDSGDNGGGYAPPGGGGSDDANLLVRVERLEDQIRQMTGQLQQMEFENHQLQDQLKKFEQDVDFRFQESHGAHPSRHSELTPEDSPTPVQTPAPAADDSAASADSSDTGTDAAADASGDTDTSNATPHSGRNDAFDPNAHPGAPGAPKPLGAGESAPPPPVADNSGASSDPNAPLNLQSAYTPPPAAAPSSTPAGGVTTPGGTMMASAEVATPRSEFDTALGYYKQKDYDNAQRSFSAFLDKNPHSHLMADALYLLGESYAAQGRTREAAEQFLKISTSYTTSSRAPEAMLRLGESLRTLGAKEQACATFIEVPRKYPNAPPAVKAGAEREAKRSQCGA